MIPQSRSLMLAKQITTVLVLQCKRCKHSTIHRVISSPNIKADQSKQNSQSHDLHRFLLEVSKDPAETKFWYRQFQRSADKNHPFAVLQVSKDVLADPLMMESLSSNVSFLQRLNLGCVLVHGYSPSEMANHNQKDVRTELVHDSMQLVGLLEKHSSPARPLFGGCGLIEAADVSDQLSEDGAKLRLNLDPIYWALGSGHVPVIQSCGETSGGQLINLPVDQVTRLVAEQLKPRKVLLIGTEKGLQDETGKVVANVNVPADSGLVEKRGWCKGKISHVEKLLDVLPAQSSVVITSPITLLTELFTCNGSGTLFKKLESIDVFHTVKEVDVKRLLELISRTFKRKIKPNYLDEIESKLDTLYLSNQYNAVAIVTKDKSLGVPYLDKLAVSSAGQGEGLCQMLWEKITLDHPALFWRSRVTNTVNSWYFKRCSGSYRAGNWIVFWYGIDDHQITAVLTAYAHQLPETFVSNDDIDKSQEVSNAQSIGGSDKTYRSHEVSNAQSIGASKKGINQIVSS